MLEKLTIEIFGESHASEIGVKLFGFPAGEAISEDAVRGFLARRKSGLNPCSTPRREDDDAVFLSGIKDGKSDGEVITAVIKNVSVKPSDYEEIKYVPRPSHADYPAFVKYGRIPSGGGAFSGRMTAPLCIAGAIAAEALARRGIFIGAYMSKIGKTNGASYRDREITSEEIEAARSSAFPALANGEAMIKEIEKARSEGDSVGGTAECAIFGAPAGLGGALFSGLESKIAALAFGIPAVKAVEFGAGTEFSGLFGSLANDALGIKNQRAFTYTNNSGGLNGGMTNGMPILFRVTFRPAPSIAKEQKSVDLRTMTETTIKIAGRH
ncbi:MAG TPA: chorismate synthase, partial [Clostridia bacterium]|nr:chorismate synthase [Clostridia bacterium]